MTARNFLCTKNLKEVKLEMSTEEYLKYIFEKLPAANYQWLIVTSQYKIEDIFKDPATVEALNRRFNIYNINNINNLKLTFN